MRSIIFMGIILFTSYASALTDYVCVNNCTSQGYIYGLCVKKCSTNDNFNYNKVKQTDYMCVNRCTANGYLYNVCVSKCSY